MTVKLLQYDGRSLKTTDAGFADEWYTTSPPGRRTPSGITVYDAYDYVADVFRCVNIRKSELARIPFILEFNGSDVSEDKAWRGRIRDIQKKLARIESSLCLTGAAYLLRQSNALGLANDLRFLLSNSLTIQSDGQRGVYGFYRNSGEIGFIPAEQMVYIWIDSYRDETQPGQGEAQVALQAAGVLYSIDSMITQYFNSGAVKVTAFTVPSGADEAEAKKFQNFLNRRLSGVWNAFKNIVVRFKLEPMILGSELKDTEAPEISDRKQSDIAKALGVPPNMLKGEYKYKTVDSEYLNFILGTIAPRHEWIVNELNEQFYNDLGLEIIPAPERMEVLQSSQLEQAQVAQTLVGPSPILDVNEGRKLIGYEPRPMRLAAPVGAPASDALNSPATQAADAPVVNSVLTNLTGKQQINLSRIIRQFSQGKTTEEQATLLLTNGFGVTADEARKLLGLDDIESPAPATEIKARDVDLQKWRVKAQNSLTKTGSPVVEFSSLNIPPRLNENIYASLAGCKTADDVSALVNGAAVRYDDEQRTRAVDMESQLVAALREAAAALKAVPPPPVPQQPHNFYITTPPVNVTNSTPEIKANIVSSPITVNIPETKSAIWPEMPAPQVTVINEVNPTPITNNIVNPSRSLDIKFKHDREGNVISASGTSETSD